MRTSPGNSNTACTVSGTSRSSFQKLIEPKPVTAVGSAFINQPAWSIGWLPISPIRPIEVALFRRQLSAFSCSGLGEVARQLVFLCHCDQGRTVLPRSEEGRVR